METAPPIFVIIKQKHTCRNEAWPKQSYEYIYMYLVFDSFLPKYVDESLFAWLKNKETEYSDSFVYIRFT